MPMPIPACVRACVHVCMYACMHVACVYVCMHACVHVWYAFICVCVVCMRPHCALRSVSCVTSMPMSTCMLAVSQSCLHLALGLTASPSSPAHTRHQTTKSHLSDNRHNTRITTHKDTPSHNLENTKSRNTGPPQKKSRIHITHTHTHNHTATPVWQGKH